MPLPPRQSTGGYPVQKPYEAPPMATVQPGAVPQAGGGMDFMGLLQMIGQNQQALLAQSRQPVSQISKDQHTQRGTPGLDQWYRNNPGYSSFAGAPNPNAPAPTPAPTSPAPQPALLQSPQTWTPPPMDMQANQYGGMNDQMPAAPQTQQQVIQPQGPPQPQGYQAAPQQAQPPNAAPQPGMQPPGGLSYIPPREGPVPTQQPQAQPPQPAPIPQNPMADVSGTQEGFNEPVQTGPGLGGLIQGGIGGLGLAQLPGSAAGVVAGNLGNIATHAGNQLPILSNAYTSALGNVAKGQGLLSQGAMTAGELAPTMRAANTAYGALQSGVGAAESAAGVAGRAGNVANALAGGSRLAPILSTASKFAAPLQAGLMGIEGFKLATDEGYRDQQMAAHDRLGQEGALSGLGRGLTAPISTIAGTGGDLLNLMGRDSEATVNNRADRMAGQTSRNTAEVSKLRKEGKSPQDIQTYMSKFRKRNNR